MNKAGVRLAKQFLNSRNQRQCFPSVAEVTVLVEPRQMKEGLWMLESVQPQSWGVGPVYSHPEAKPAQKGVQESS